MNIPDKIGKLPDERTTRAGVDSVLLAQRFGATTCRQSRRSFTHGPVQRVDAVVRVVVRHLPPARVDVEERLGIWLAACRQRDWRDHHDRTLAAAEARRPQRLVVFLGAVRPPCNAGRTGTAGGRFSEAGGRTLACVSTTPTAARGLYFTRPATETERALLEHLGYDVPADLTPSSTSSTETLRRRRWPQLEGDATMTTPRLPNVAPRPTGTAGIAARR